MYSETESQFPPLKNKIKKMMQFWRGKKSCKGKLTNTFFYSVVETGFLALKSFPCNANIRKIVKKMIHLIISIIDYSWKSNKKVSEKHSINNVKIKLKQNMFKEQNTLNKHNILML